MPGFYHLSIKIGSRSSGRSAVAAAAYRSGTKIKDVETGIVADYTRKGGVVYSEIILPENAPAEYMSREILWNAVEKVEKQSNAQLFREFEIAFPKEMTFEQQVESAKEFAKHRADEGMIVDFSIHIPDKATKNPHCHMMCTTRGILPDGKWASKEKKDYLYELDEKGNRIPEIDPETGLQKVKVIRGEKQLQWKKIPEIDPKTGEQKVRVRKGKGVEKIWKRGTVEINDWNRQAKAEEWRKDWADVCNKYLEKENHVDHRSYERQGIDRISTVHEGYASREIEARGGVSDRCEINRNIRKSNEMLEILKAEIQVKIQRLTYWIKGMAYELRDRIAEIQSRSAGGRTDDVRSADAGRNSGTTAGRDRRAEGYDSQIDRREREAAEISSAVQRGAEKAERRESEIARAESEIIEIFERIELNRKAKDDRIRKLMERRRSTHTAGATAGRNRGTDQSDTDAIIREAEAGIRRADAVEKDSISGRKDREIERQRQAAAESSRADEERRKAKERRKRRSARSRSDDRSL